MTTPSQSAAGRTDRFKIRPMEIGDLEQVRAIDQLSFSMPWPASAYVYELNENPLSLLWVAEAPDAAGELRVVGMIVVWLVVDEAHIATIAVLPEYRGQGIGARLLAVALEAVIGRRTESAPMRSATLEVRAGNTVAQELYRRFKFEVAGSRPRYYRDNSEDALIMTLSPLGPDYLDWLHSLA
jgi:ribosomal-protein-alanine N-acetyltransferase